MFEHVSIFQVLFYCLYIFHNPYFIFLYILYMFWRPHSLTSFSKLFHGASRGDGGFPERHRKLTLVDLAGSEKVCCALLLPRRPPPAPHPYIYIYLYIYIYILIAGGAAHLGRSLAHYTPQFCVPLTEHVHDYKGPTRVRL